MAKNYKQKMQRHKTFFYTFVSAIIVCAAFLIMIFSFYRDAETDAYDMLHIQTKQIKDDLVLQINSDRENLVTMSNFAAKLYADSESYDLMFESFKPIGLFSNIGILNPDGTFVTKSGSVDLSEKISFSEEAARGEYISGRVEDLTREGEEIIRSAVPIIADGETVGVLYGVIHPETIEKKYESMAEELDAQLFVYDKETGKFMIDTVNEKPAELSWFSDREYRFGHSYEEIISTDKGYSAFHSILRDENLYVHYSTLEDFNWGIMLARYESQVFEETYRTVRNLLIGFVFLVIALSVYLQLILNGEKESTRLNAESSEIKKHLLETKENYTNITKAIRNITEFTGARSAFYRNTDGEDYLYTPRAFRGLLLKGEDRQYFHGELFKYALNGSVSDHSSIGFIRLKPDKKLRKENPELCAFLKEHGIRDVSVAVIAEDDSFVSILGTVNAKRSGITRRLLEDIAICFSIAMYNKKHLSRTELAAVTDSLTGTLNRVAYNRDIRAFDEEGVDDLSCIYIDVNELHIRNNKFGHAAGDEMLLYIANTLKKLFFGQSVYRMGGDEFLVFVKNTDPETVKESVVLFREQLQPKGYHVAIGLSYRTRCMGCEEIVNEAEIRMYEAKAQYYLNKRQRSEAQTAQKAYVYAPTGVREIDTLLPSMQEHYEGIYRVSLARDCVDLILSPAYMEFAQHEENFSRLFAQYIEELVHSDYNRPIRSFLNFDAIRRQLLEKRVPAITYKKTDGETITLSVYALSDENSGIDETLWVFSRD